MQKQQLKKQKNFKNKWHNFFKVEISHSSSLNQQVNAMRKLILFELNEVPWSILDYYIKKYPQSQLAKILPLSSQYETITEDKGHLSPWITWPTLHRGVHNEMHGIQDFGEDLSKIDAEYPPIWKILHQNNIDTGVFASMHSFPPPANYEHYSFYVPDPFAGESTVHPKKLIPFQNFNLKMSRKSGRNVDTGIDWQSASSLGLTLPQIGIKPKTLISVGEQLVQERLKPWVRTRRRSYQSVLAFDVFMKLMKTRQPSFATFLSNHVASTMHRYWAATFPADYNEYELSEEWKMKYGKEIDFTMYKFDEFLRELVKFVKQHKEYKLIVASSMGQKATEAKLILKETACKNLTLLMNFLEVPSTDWEMLPAMHPQYNFKVSEGQITNIQRKLNSLTIADKPLSYREKEGGFFSIDLGHRNLAVLQGVYQGNPIDLEKLGIYNEEVEDQTGSTAYHVPEGSLWVYDPLGKKETGRVYGISSRSVAPSILQNFEIDVPDYMIEERVNAIVD